METLIGLALKSLLIAAATLGLLHLTRRRSAADRSWIAHLGLFALVALPLASLALPALSIELPAALHAPTRPRSRRGACPRRWPPSWSIAPLVTHGAAARATSAPQRSTGRPFAYAVPVIACSLVTLLALLRLFALRGRAQVLVDPVWLGALAHAQRRMGFKNGTALLTSVRTGSPISWGLMRPVILLNDEALAASGEAEAIIAHELAHVARLDWAKLMLARVATAIFWFNPLAWVLAREAHQLREEAADDAVLAANVADTDYAQLLVGVARHECRGLLLGAHGISPGKGSLRRRVSRVLDAERGARRRGPVVGRGLCRRHAGDVGAACRADLRARRPSRTEPPRAAPPRPRAGAAVRAPKRRSRPMPRRTGASRCRSRRRLPPAAARGRCPAARRDSTTTPAPLARRCPSPPTRCAMRRRRPCRARGERAPRADADRAMRGVPSAPAATRRSTRSRCVLGVTPEYVAAIRAAGPQFRKLDEDEMIDLRVKGVTPEYRPRGGRRGLWP